MLKYLLKRLLIFIPTLIVISLITFMLSALVPGDPVDNMLNKNAGSEGQAAQKLATEKAYIELRHNLGLDLPIFYFSVSDATQSDTLYRIPKRNHRETLERLSFNYGVWENVQTYYKSVVDYENEIYSIESTDSSRTYVGRIRDQLNYLYDNYEDNKIQNAFGKIEEALNATGELAKYRTSFQALKENYKNMVENASTGNRYTPRLHWYGLENQYHTWMFGDKPWFFGEKPNYTSAGFVRGDFGISYQDKRPVASVLWDAISWTFWISLVSLIIAYLLAIPLGVNSAINKGTRKDKIITTTLFVLYSLPSFWIGTMLIIYLCGGDYLSWFPPAVSLMQHSYDAGFFEKGMTVIYYLIVPIFCWTYGSLAYLSRQMRGGMLTVLNQDFIRTARAKGLEDKTVVWKHAFRNSLLPIITIFAAIFPAIISGSIVLEFIFSIPGMGKISLDALVSRNYPIVFTVMMFTAILTLVGMLVADIMYALVDPRISYSSKK